MENHSFKSFAHRHTLDSLLFREKTADEYFLKVNYPVMFEQYVRTKPANSLGDTAKQF